MAKESKSRRKDAAGDVDVRLALALERIASLQARQTVALERCADNLALVAQQAVEGYRDEHGRPLRAA